MITKISFFKEVIKSMKTSGTVTPSSKYLVNSLIENIDFSFTNTIVEFGPGNGVITKKLLQKMNENSRLILFEINEKFYIQLKKIDDHRLIVLNTSAEDIISSLNILGIEKIDYCVSSIPLSNLPKQTGLNIITNTYSLIKKNGVFIQFQYSLQYYKLFKKIFGNKSVDIKFELLNIPPAFIYNCLKK